jgi:hypothetical protein
MTGLRDLAGADARLLFTPRSTYRELLARPWRPGMAGRRPALILLVLGTSIAFAATRSLTLPLLLDTIIWWSVVPLLQFCFALVLVLSAGQRVTGALHAVDLMFAAHLPWSLWLLGAAGFLALGGAVVPARTVLVLLPFVLGWRAVLLYHFCRVVLACDRRGALLRTAVHQTAVFTALFAFVAWAISLEARLT